MSHPPDYPGRERLKRASSRAGTDAYQGAFEAVGAVLVACAFGFWFDKSWDTSPWGLIVGVVIGFAAMVLRLVRLGEELNVTGTGNEADGTNQARPDSAEADGLGSGTGVSPGMSDALREDEPTGSAKDATERSTEKTEEKTTGAANPSRDDESR